MKIVTLTLVAAAFLLAQDKDSKQGKDANKSEPTKVAPSEAPRSPLVPKGAVRVEPNLYRYVDPQGKIWFYRQLPFGISKYEEKPADQPLSADDAAAVVRDLGDSVEFQRMTPFGISKWVRKKSDLTDEEKGLIAADEAKRTAASKERDKKDTAKTTPAAKSSDKNSEKQEKR